MTKPPVSDGAVKAATGRDWAGWVTELNTWAEDLDHREIAKRLSGEYELSSWWAQSVTGGWERLSGRRSAHEMPGGFQATASKTIHADPELVTAAFIEPSVFSGWGPDGALEVTKSVKGRTFNARWNGVEGGRVSIHLSAADNTTRIALSHENLRDAKSCETLKKAWRTALATLKERLES